MSEATHTSSEAMQPGESDTWQKWEEALEQFKNAPVDERNLEALGLLQQQVAAETVQALFAEKRPPLEEQIQKLAAKQGISVQIFR